MAVRNSNRFALKSLKGLGLVSSVFGGLSILSLVNYGFSIGWTQPFRWMIEKYLELTSSFKYYTEPYILPLFEYLTQNFFVEINYGANWPDIFLLMIIYLGARVKSYFSSGKIVRSISMLVLSIFISVLSAFFASSVNLSTWIDVAISVSIPLLGFLVYDLAYAVIGSSLDRRRRPWFEEFIRHIWFSTPLLLITLLINVFLANRFISSFNFGLHQTFVLVFAIDYFLISTFWAYKSFQHAKYGGDRLMAETISERFWRSSATNVSLNVAIVLSSAIFSILVNAGNQIVGSGAIHIP